MIETVYETTAHADCDDWDSTVARVYGYLSEGRPRVGVSIAVYDDEDVAHFIAMCPRHARMYAAEILNAIDAVEETL